MYSFSAYDLLSICWFNRKDSSLVDLTYYIMECIMQLAIRFNGVWLEDGQNLDRRFINPYIIWRMNI